ncbi:general secretion pathway protein H, partial [Vibrio parahaemolyticus V-223/04]
VLGIKTIVCSSRVHCLKKCLPTKLKKRK